MFSNSCDIFLLSMYSVSDIILNENFGTHNRTFRYTFQRSKREDRNLVSRNISSNRAILPTLLRSLSQFILFGGFLFRNIFAIVLFIHTTSSFLKRYSLSPDGLFLCVIFVKCLALRWTSYIWTLNALYSKIIGFPRYHGANDVLSHFEASW